MKLVLFDCDGTLVDSAAVIHRCMELTFADFGMPQPAFAATKSVIGLTLNLAIARMLQRDVNLEIEAMTARYKEHFLAYRQQGGPLEPLYDGIAQLIDGLALEPKTILGIVTGKSRRGLAMILAHHGYERTFVTIRTADDCPSKPHPAMVLECCAETGISPAATYVIGDSVYDIEMAKAAGAAAIGVSWGYGAPEQLRAAGARHVAQVAADIPGLLISERPIHA